MKKVEIKICEYILLMLIFYFIIFLKHHPKQMYILIHKFNGFMIFNDN